MLASNFAVRGVITALVTPFDEKDQVNENALEQLVEFQIRAGVHGLSPCGTTGEFALLTLEERQRVAEIVVRVANKRVPVLVQTGAATTDAAIALTRHAQKIGASAANLIAPYYYHLDDDALIQHYVRIASSVPDFPLYLYNFPARTGNNLTPAVVHAIAERCQNVVGMKDSSGNLAQIIESAAARGGRFNVAVGSDGLMLPAAMVGIPAAISGNANPCPEIFVELYKAIWRGDWVTAQAAQARIQHLRRILKDGSDLSLFKAVLNHRGIAMRQVRPPLLDAPKDVAENAIKALINHGIELTRV